jgi:hypothetical protein
VRTSVGAPVAADVNQKRTRAHGYDRRPFVEDHWHMKYPRILTHRCYVCGKYRPIETLNWHSPEMATCRPGCSAVLLGYLKAGYGPALHAEPKGDK